jgi:hypothetical protein
LLFYYGLLLQKNSPEIRFDPDLGDLAIPHAIVSVNKLFYTIHYTILCGLCMKKINIAHEVVVTTILYYE